MSNYPEWANLSAPGGPYEPEDAAAEWRAEIEEAQDRIDNLHDWIADHIKCGLRDLDAPTIHDAEEWRERAALLWRAVEWLRTEINRKLSLDQEIPQPQGGQS